MITLDRLDSQCQSISIKSSTGQELAIDGSGFITANINGIVETTPAAFSAWKTSNETVGVTESQLASTALVDRLKVTIQNLGPGDVYVSDVTGVSSDDLVIPCGSSWTESLDDGASIFALASEASTDVRISEFKA